MDGDEALTCWLCDRAIDTLLQWHHPVPKAKKGRGTVPVHPICHKAIHTHFTNSQLARIGDDRAVILAHVEIAKFVSWVSSKPPDFHAPTRTR
ncbi:HNH endonuclease [Altererythrobacter litoralis]|uniref:HNH endonuclease n=1 Tax=Altererythrobacter litoralis TaxID=3113904 RepID=A0ABU7GDI5_9SPHN|nr:HNH endonuclease [Erythrobacteraceae bacterium 1XM1-14]HSM53917.1 HNH endonuclease [Erythrobacter sp.]